MMKKLTSGLFAAALILALPLTANAQDAAVPAEEAPTCTAIVAPIQASDNVIVTASFDQPFGKVVAIEAPAVSGLALAPEEQTEMADEAVEGELGAEPAPLGAEENASTFTLNASATEPGTYMITLNNEAGESCSAEITVEEKSDDEWNEEVEIQEEDDIEDTEDGEEY
jgi:hypothetical protein